MTIAEDKKRICVGVIVGSHGLRGLIKIKSFTVVSEDIFVHGPLTDKDGKRRFALELVSSSKKGLIVKLEGVTTRDASEALRGIELYLSRDLLPNLKEDEFYYSDLIGLVVENTDGEIIGNVSMVDNYGAGEIIEVDLQVGGTAMYRMSLEVVPEIDLKNGRIVVNPPTEVLTSKIRDADEGGES